MTGTKSAGTGTTTRNEVAGTKSLHVERMTKGKHVETQDIERPWQNGFTLKKTRDGYSWTISFAATDNSVEAMLKAVEKTREVDLQLRRMYGDPKL